LLDYELKPPFIPPLTKVITAKDLADATAKNLLLVDKIAVKNY